MPTHRALIQPKPNIDMRKRKLDPFEAALEAWPDSDAHQQAICGDWWLMTFLGVLLVAVGVAGFLIGHWLWG